MSTKNIIFFSLSMLMYILMYVGGRGMKHSRTKRMYWICSFLPILAFTLNMGLRWGRGTDYNNGFYAYQRIANGINVDSYEPVWKATIGLFANVLHLPWQAMVLFLSFLVVLSVVVYLQKDKSVARFAIPFFAFLVFPSENLIRWFYAFSLFLIGLYYLRKRSYFWGILFSVLAILTHYAIAVVIVPICALLFIKKPLLPPIVAIACFILIFRFIDLSNIAFIENLLSMVNLGDGFANYQQDIGGWLSNAYGDYSGAMTGTALITSPLLLWLGYSVLRYHPRLTFEYNVMTVGLLLMPAFVGVQMAYRIALVFYCFQFLILAYIFQDYIVRKRRKKNQLIRLAAILVLVIFVRSMVVQPLVKSPNETLYVWDANGRDTL